MRVALVSDTHMPRGERRLPDACVAELQAADAILHAGDLMRVEVLDLLEAIGPPVHAISGNVDDDAVRDRLPPTRVVQLGDVMVGMVHIPGPSTGRVARLRALFPDADAVVYGHTHQPEHLTDPATGFQVFNPGSPTERRRAPGHTMGRATVDGGAITFELLPV